MRTERDDGRLGGWLPHRHVYGRGGLALFLWFAGWSVSGSVPEPIPGSSVCRQLVDASTWDYLTGVACPPVGFSDELGYEPVLVRMPWGWRFTKPAWADGRCSGPLRGVSRSLNVEPACRTHDYGYDLVRFGMGSRPDADSLLYRDMMSACAEQSSMTRGGCRAVAHWTRTVLEVGDATGFDPEPRRAE